MILKFKTEYILSLNINKITDVIKIKKFWKENLYYFLKRLFSFFTENNYNNLYFLLSEMILLYLYDHTNLILYIFINLKIF